jgi:hypothetical protein
MVAEKNPGQRQVDRVAEVPLLAPQADGDHPPHAASPSPRHHPVEVAGQVLEVEVGVRVDQRNRHYFTRVPGATPSPTVTTCR